MTPHPLLKPGMAFFCKHAIPGKATSCNSLLNIIEFFADYKWSVETNMLQVISPADWVFLHNMKSLTTWFAEIGMLCCFLYKIKTGGGIVCQPPILAGPKARDRQAFLELEFGKGNRLK